MQAALAQIERRSVSKLPPLVSDYRKPGLPLPELRQAKAGVVT
jgi:hypothetical protein